MDRQHAAVLKSIVTIGIFMCSIALLGVSGCGEEPPVADPGDESGSTSTAVSTGPSNSASTSTSTSTSTATSSSTSDQADTSTGGETGTSDGSSTAGGESSGTATEGETEADTEAGPVCGDGIVEGDEACDDGDNNNDATADACRTDCSLPTCGDGVVDSREACDDAENNDDVAPDACRTNCGLPSCGDGVVDAAEECDDGAANDDVAPDACRTNCFAPGCGDAVLDTGESCDAGKANSDSTPDACRTTCEPAGCGDNVLDAGEDCDDGNTITDSCDYGLPCTVCTGACAQGPGVETFCGDAVINGPEECDNGVGNDDLAPDACRTTCVAAACQDSVIDSGEECDDGNPDDLDGCESSCTFICQGAIATSSGAERAYLYGATCYLVHLDAAPWDVARLTCSDNDGWLAAVDDEDENGILTAMTGGPDTWIGYSDIDDEGNFSWIEGSSTFEAWNAGEPNNAGDNEDCAAIRVPNGNWNDLPCDVDRAFICEMTDCGNGVIDGGETCDDGNAATEFCEYGEASCTVCNFECVDGPGRLTFCGDGVLDVEDGENCDDGGAVTLDGCDDVCAVEPGATCFDDEPTRCYASSVSATSLALAFTDDGYDGTLASMACASVDVVSVGDDLLDAVLVEMALDHTWIGDLVIKLVHPSGTVITLMNRPGLAESADDGTGGVGRSNDLESASPLTFHSGGATDAESMGGAMEFAIVCSEDGLCDYSPNAGAATPGDLDSLLGSSVGGAWQLCVGDAAGGDLGALDSFTLLYTE